MRLKRRMISCQPVKGPAKVPVALHGSSAAARSSRRSGRVCDVDEGLLTDREAAEALRGGIAIGPVTVVVSSSGSRLGEADDGFAGVELEVDDGCGDAADALAVVIVEAGVPAGVPEGVPEGVPVDVPVRVPVGVPVVLVGVLVGAPVGVLVASAVDDVVSELDDDFESHPASASSRKRSIVITAGNRRISASLFRLMYAEFTTSRGCENRQTRGMSPVARPLL